MQYKHVLASVFNDVLCVFNVVSLMNYAVEECNVRIHVIHVTGMISDLYILTDSAGLSSGAITVYRLSVGHTMLRTTLMVIRKCKQHGAASRVKKNLCEYPSVMILV